MSIYIALHGALSNGLSNQSQQLVQHIKSYILNVSNVASLGSDKLSIQWRKKNSVHAYHCSFCKGGPS